MESTNMRTNNESTQTKLKKTVEIEVQTGDGTQPVEMGT